MEPWVGIEVGDSLINLQAIAALVTRKELRTGVPRVVGSEIFLMDGRSITTSLTVDHIKDRMKQAAAALS